MGIAASDCSGTVWVLRREGRGGKERAAARQKRSLNNNAWMDYTPVQDLHAYETVLFVAWFRKRDLRLPAHQVGRQRRRSSVGQAEE